MKVLLIEDDSDTAAFIAKGLRQHGHTVDSAYTGKAGLMLAAAQAYDVAVIDRMLPEVDGITIVKTLRGAQVTTPVLFLTALGGIDDRVTGLDAGADDYLIKPFAFSELLARLNALARRPPINAPETSLQIADLRIDLLTRTVHRQGQPIELQPREFKLLEYLARHAGQIVTRTMMLEHVWEFHFDPQTNVVETHISRLRTKIDKPFDPPLLHTVRGAGYCLRAPD